MSEFSKQDYIDLARKLRMAADKPYMSAILSNNFNVILGALDLAAAPTPQSPPQRFGDGTKEGTGE